MLAGLWTPIVYRNTFAMRHLIFHVAEIAGTHFREGSSSAVGVWCGRTKETLEWEFCNAPQLTAYLRADKGEGRNESATTVETCLRGVQIKKNNNKKELCNLKRQRGTLAH